MRHNETDRAPGTWFRHPVRTWGLIAGAFVLIGSGCMILGLQEHQHALAGPAPSSRVPKAVKAKTAPVNTAVLATARSTPVELEIPAISLTVSLSTLGLNPDDTVQVPTDVQQPGWYGLGPSPGQIGSAVILGHVDSQAGPAVFFELRSLVAGDVVNATLADGVTAEFKVTSAAMYPKTSFPTSWSMRHTGIVPCNWLPAVEASTSRQATISPTWSSTHPW